MTDFRRDLYAKYVTAFKADHNADDEDHRRRYRAWCRHKLRPLLRGVDRSATVLELGCGTGALLQWLSEEGFIDVRGIDASPEMTSIASRSRLNVQVADVFDFFSATHDRFGVVIALDFIEHFTKEELLRLLGGIYEHLTPGGALLLQTPNGEGLLPNHVIYGDLTHMSVLTPDSLRQALRLTGFVGIEFRETGPVPKSILGTIRVALWSAIRLAASAVKLVETGRRQRIWTENMLCLCYRSKSA